MFEQAIAIEWGRANRAWTTAAGAGGELLLVAVLAIAPLVAPQGLPRLRYLIPLVAPPSYQPARPTQPARPARATAPRIQLVSGNPLLVRAALDAVRQWLYSPTLLNGEPVEVLAPITVTFRLD